MMKFCLIILILIRITFGNSAVTTKSYIEEERSKIIVDVIASNLKSNGWNTILCMGDLSDAFYNEIQRIFYAFVITNIHKDDEEINDVIPYYSKFIIMSSTDFANYEQNMLKIINSPYWHPLANIIIYYHSQDKEILSKLFFTLWYYKAINAIIVQYDDDQKSLLASVYSPYATDNYKLDHNYGCWTARKIGMPIPDFQKGFVCVDTCQNVSLHSKYRADYLGTCIGYKTIKILYNSSIDLKELNLFEDKAKNLHGFALRAYATEVDPFMFIDVLENGTYRMRSRDGSIWNTISSLMNFTIDLSPSADVMKKPFNFETNIKQIFSFAQRKGDVYLIPIYLFDYVVVEVDFTFPFEDSGICILSHRADFETTIFDVKSLKNYYGNVLQILICFLAIWLTFAIYKFVDKGKFTLDQLGKDMMNAFRHVLLITLHNPPKRNSFRVFLTASVWGLFVISFATQATIISLFTAVKRGKEVDTFDDVIEKGYIIEAMASPDLILPDTEEKFRKINSKLVPIQDLYGCVNHMSNDSRRFCFIDCAVGRYTQRNMLNENGEQYLHLAKRDRIHSHYLNIILYKHSPITEQFSQYMMRFFEAGFIKKWQQYKYADIKDDAVTKPLGMKDVMGLIHCYCICVGFTFVVFVIELLTYHLKKVNRISI